MKKVKLTLIAFMTTSILFVGCGADGNSAENEAGTSTEVSAALPDNTPKGQASVVDNVSDNDILKVALSSTRPYNLGCCSPGSGN